MVLPVAKAMGMTRTLNSVNDFESHVQDDVDILALLILWNDSLRESSPTDQFSVPVQSIYQINTVVTIFT